MVESTEDLEKLAEACLSAAKTIKQYLASNGLPQMSFDQNGPAFFPTATPEIQYARMGLRDAAMKLYDLTSGPDNILTDEMYCKIHELNAFRYVHQFGLVKLVPLNSTISYADLAAKGGVDAAQLKQMMNILMSVHVFSEPQPGQISHTAASKLLLEPNLEAYNKWLSLDTWKFVNSQIDAIEKWGHGAQEPTEAAMNIAYNTDKYQYQYFEDHPVLLDRFSRVMTYVNDLPSLSREHIKAGFDWPSLGEATVVDIAGNVGASSIAIAEANPQVKMIVQDLPGVVARAQDPSTSAIPEGLRPRFSFMAHNFYDAQPVHADAYFLRMIMHDYSDQYAANILRAIVPAMTKPNARIILMDILKLAPGVLPGPIERFICAQDLQMMALTNARERDYAEWAALVKLADPRLRIANIVSPPGSAMAVIEVVLDTA